MEKNIKPEYLGDGVYVDFNNHQQVVISVNHHKNIVVYLEPEVAQKVIEYIQKTQKE